MNRGIPTQYPATSKMGPTESMPALRVRKPVKIKARLTQSKMVLAKNCTFILFPVVGTTKPPPGGNPRRRIDIPGPLVNQGVAQDPPLP